MGRIHGLSPRLRGNLNVSIPRQDAVGSIPAPAGEPATATGGPSPRRVYPRACGGTSSCPQRRMLLTGLSPRLRGNRGARARPGDWQRSIPAPAGEPRLDSHKVRSIEVYPRACGGTAEAHVIRGQVMGLSPRLRGNLAAEVDAQVSDRSIPAPAGEPQRHRRRAIPRAVYPRACGGTKSGMPHYHATCGLSPRLRGNRGGGVNDALIGRSIPAPAGEPLALP